MNVELARHLRVHKSQAWRGIKRKRNVEKERVMPQCLENIK